nr:hypothetical protein [Tanacetum cinerariifolium]
YHVPTEGQAGLDPGNDAEPQPQSSPVFHVGPNLKHIDLEATDVSTQPHSEKMDEGFGDVFFNDKHSKADNEKTTAETEAESMVSVTIQQDTSAIPPIKTQVIDLTSKPNSPNVHRLLHVTATETTTTTTTHPLPPQLQQSTIDSMLIKCIGELEKIMENLIQDNKYLEERASGSSQVSPPPPPPLSTNHKGQSHGSIAPSSLKTAASAEYTAWTTTDTRLKLYVSLIPKDLHMDDDIAPDAQPYSSDDEYIRNAHTPKMNLQQDWWKPLKEDRLAIPKPAWSLPSSNLLTGDMAMFMNWFYKRQGITKLEPQHLEGPAFKLFKVFHPIVIHLQYQMEEYHKLLTDSVKEPIIKHNVSKPLPLGGPPGQLTIQTDFFFNKDLEYLRYDSKEKMVPDQMWIKEEYKHTFEGDHKAGQTHMQIVSVVIIEVFFMYGYNYMKKIVLRRADLNEHIIAERDFKYLYPSDFEDLQRVEDLQLGIESYQTQLNLTKPQWDATGFKHKQDFMIDEALDYRVKEFKVNRMNPGLNIRFSTRKDVDRSKEFMFSIQKRLKTRRIFHNLGSFVDGRVREEDYRLL